MSKIRFDAELIRRYDLSVPPYTSYPTPPHFHASFDVLAYRRAALLSNAALETFQAEIRIPSHLGTVQERYLQCLHREIELQGELFDPRRSITQLTISGDATVLEAAAVQQLLDQLDRHLQRAPHAELCIEFDPCTATATLIRQFAALGFNCTNFCISGSRYSMDRALELTEMARRCGIKSLGFDLIYGLSLQTTRELEQQLRLALAAKPERLSTYVYPHLPELHRAQPHARPSRRPSTATLLELRQLTIDTLTRAGYVDLGMDRFAAGEAAERPVRPCDLLGMGAGAISRIGTAYAQNAKQPADYCEALQRHVLPIECGVELTVDDVVRREVIQQIMRHRSLDFGAISRRYALDFHSYFARELTELRTLADEGLVVDSDTGFAVSARGQLLMQNITTVFDAYRHSAT